MLAAILKYYFLAHCLYGQAGNSRRRDLSNALALKLWIHGQYSSRDGNAMVIKSLLYRREDKIARLSCLRQQRKVHCLSASSRRPDKVKVPGLALYTERGRCWITPAQLGTHENYTQTSYNTMIQLFCDRWLYILYVTSKWFGISKSEILKSAPCSHSWLIQACSKVFTSLFNSTFVN